MTNYSERSVYDGSGNRTHYGEAEPGTIEQAARWRIRKMAYDSNGNVTSVTWADGDAEFDNVWEDYASLDYQ